jgi:hypothetical protein
MTVPAAENLRQAAFIAGAWGDRDAVPPMLLAADLLDAIDALPDRPDVKETPGTIGHINGYMVAMRQVKALLHPAPEEDK